MGRYDDISDARLRYEIQRFARILQRMEENDEVLDRTADILTLLGELRRMVFAWEVRATYRGEVEEGSAEDPYEGSLDTPDDPESDSERVVREAREQHSDFLGGLGSGPDGEASSDGDGEGEEDEEGRPDRG